MSETIRMRLPLIATGQAQKEVTHNEALSSLDILVHGLVLDADRTEPPIDPAEGDSHLIGTGATGAFAGFDHHIASWIHGAWRFEAPFDGLRVRVRNLAVDALFEQGVWQFGTVGAVRIDIGGVQVIGARQPAIPVPSGGTMIDNESRAAIAAILAMLVHHGLIEST